MDGRHYRNRYCNCQRCRFSAAMGPAVLVTLGILFLLDTMDVKSFHYTWPFLLIVIGVVKVLGYNASAEGHVPRQGMGPGPNVQVPPPPPPASAARSDFAAGGVNDSGSRGIDHV